MALMHSNPAEVGSTAPEFDLPGIDGKRYSLSSFGNSRILVIAFICNHCPYVKAVQGRIAKLARDYSSRGVQWVGINPNDWSKYPDDSPEAMKRQAQEQGFAFPYLYDESQSVARAYDAVCTPDFYVYSNEGGKFVLRYRGRLDDNWKEESAVTRHELAGALDALLAGQPVSREQNSSMGCSIKWR